MICSSIEHTVFSGLDYRYYIGNFRWSLLWRSLTNYKDEGECRGWKKSAEGEYIIVFESHKLRMKTRKEGKLRMRLLDAKFCFLKPLFRVCCLYLYFNNIRSLFKFGFIMFIFVFLQFCEFFQFKVTLRQLFRLQRVV